MTQLTDIVWPAIAGLVAGELDAARAAGAPVAAVEAAVLFEAGWDALFDEVWVVSAPPGVARQRLMDRNGFSAEEAGKRIASQLSNAERESARRRRHPHRLLTGRCARAGRSCLERAASPARRDGLAPRRPTRTNAPCGRQDRSSRP